MSNYTLQNDGVLNYNGVVYPYHPSSGLPWTSESIAKYVMNEEAKHVQALIDQQTFIDGELKVQYAGHIVFTSTAVNENTGIVLQAPNHEAEFSEMTITKNSVLKLVANIQSDKNDDATVLTDLPNDMFRIPIRNQDTGEQDLLLGTLDKGILTVEAALDKAGYWEVTEELINSKLPDGFNLAMDKIVFAVVSVPKTSIIESTASETPSLQSTASVSNISEPIVSQSSVSESPVTESIILEVNVNTDNATSA